MPEPNPARPRYPVVSATSVPIIRSINTLPCEPCAGTGHIFVERTRWPWGLAMEECPTCCGCGAIVLPPEAALARAVTICRQILEDAGAG